MTTNWPSTTPRTVREDTAPERTNTRLQPVRRILRPQRGTDPQVRVTMPAPGGGRRAMSTGAGIFLMTVGAILLFAISADASPGWINLHIVGLILIIAGVLGLTLPRVRRSPGRDLRRWVVPMLSSGEGPPADELDLIRRPGADGDDPTLADELLDQEHDSPIETDGIPWPGEPDSRL